VDKEKQNENRGRSQRDGLQKTQKNFTESHCSIMSSRVGGNDVTTRVDLTCRKDGWGGKPGALNATAARGCYPADNRFPARQIVLLLAGFKIAELVDPTRTGIVKRLNCHNTCASVPLPKTSHFMVR
jgi:hypothetical protein